MASVSDLSKGNYVRYNGEVVQIEELLHRTPGNLRAFYQVKMRSVRTGKIVENRFRPGDAIDQLRVETKEYQYLYQDGDSLVCMDNDTFEQIYLDKVLLGEAVNFIKEGVTLLIAFENGTNPITAEAPAHVVMEVTYTEPGVQGDTATRTLKPATLETGAEIKVPLFVNTGDKIKIKTSTGEYVERVKE
ncbi:MAG: elongation factor P [Bacteroidota bacterium]|jgi:elongation factor P|nr:elongation factor P [Bacteroidota bacterium]MCA4899364.1 elongation factor P [Cytophagales bacterium]MCE2958109.1 elongation factor P [Flammeovirgaceae bacterium]MCZ8068964.1 elongation factor P [Cytophagales bacterium]